MVSDRVQRRNVGRAVVLACAGVVGVAGLAVLGGLSSGAGPEPAKPSAATKEKAEHHDKASKSALLDVLKPLEGTWEMTDENGKTVTGLVTKLTAGGTVVCETMFPGSPHEMTNMYHPDGDDLVMTHYCAIGNQPTMRCKGSSIKADQSPKVLTFEFDSGRNMKPADMRMGKLVLTIKDADHISQAWTSYKDGKPVTDHAPVFEFTRKK